MKRLYIELTNEKVTIGSIGRDTIESRKTFQWHYGEVFNGLFYNTSQLFTHVLTYLGEFRLTKGKVVVCGKCLNTGSPIYLFPILLAISKTGLFIDQICEESLLEGENVMRFHKEGEDALDFFKPFRAPTKQSPYGWILSMGILIGTIGFGALWFYHKDAKHVSLLKQEIIRGELEIANLLKKKKSLQRSCKGGAFLDAKIGKCKDEKERLVRSNSILKKIADFIPDKTWLTSLSFAVERKKGEENKEVMKIVGRSFYDEEAFEFYRRLSENGLLKGLRIDRFDGVGSEAAGSSPMCHFEFVWNTEKRPISI
jgi:hypothetical protein